MQVSVPEVQEQILDQFPEHMYSSRASFGASSGAGFGPDSGASGQVREEAEAPERFPDMINVAMTMFARG